MVEDRAWAWVVRALNGWEVGKGLKGGSRENRCRSWECKVWEMGDLDPPVLPSPLTLPLPHTFRVQQNIKKLAGI